MKKKTFFITAFCIHLVTESWKENKLGKQTKVLCLWSENGSGEGVKFGSYQDKAT